MEVILAVPVVVVMPLVLDVVDILMELAVVVIPALLDALDTLGGSRIGGYSGRARQVGSVVGGYSCGAGARGLGGYSGGAGRGGAGGYSGAAGRGGLVDTLELVVVVVLVDLDVADTLMPLRVTMDE